MLKIYIAHNFEARDWLREEFVPKWMNGFKITSSWIYSWIYNGPHSDESDRRLSAEMDLNDVERADVLLLFYDAWQPPTTRTGRGKWVEFGYALALEKKIVLYSPTKNWNTCVFSHTEGVKWAYDMSSLMGILNQWQITNT